MLFGTDAQVNNLGDINVSIAGNTLDCVYQYKYLGVILDPKLSFCDHIKYIKKKTFPIVKLLGRIRRVLDIDTATIIDKTLILPIFEYSDYVFGNLKQQDSEMLQK